LLAFGNEVLVSDWNNDRIHRLSVTGEPLADFESAGLEQILADSRKARGQFELIAYSGVALLALVLGSLLARALAVSVSPQAATGVTAETAEQASISDTPILLEPDAVAIQKLAKAIRLSGWLVVVGGAIIGLIAYGAFRLMA